MLPAPMMTSTAFRTASARCTLSLLLASFMLIFAACGDDSVSTRIEPPSVESPIENQQLTADADPLTVDLSTVFGSDDSLEYSTSSSNTDVATANVSEATLTVDPVGGGTAEITATASNDAGSANASFTLDVNLPDPPERP